MNRRDKRFLIQKCVREASNLEFIPGHDSVDLRKHSMPCRNLDFCVIHQTQRTLADAAIALKGGKKKS